MTEHDDDFITGDEFDPEVAAAADDKRYEATSGPSRRWGIWAGLTPEERHPKPVRRRPPAQTSGQLAEQVAS